MAAIRHLKAVGPANVKRTVALPVRKPNAAYRSREHLTEREIERLIEAARDNRWGHRDSTMVLLAFRHGLRAAELVDLRWEQVDLENAILHVRRVKQGTPATR
jgi:integrase